MDTVWCRGQLRVIVSAIRYIPQGAPIVLNYDEYIKDDGSHPYFDSDSILPPPQFLILSFLILAFLLF
jgi:hypothetical protein